LPSAVVSRAAASWITVDGSAASQSMPVRLSPLSVTVIGSSLQALGAQLQQPRR